MNWVKSCGKRYFGYFSVKVTQAPISARAARQTRIALQFHFSAWKLYRSHAPRALCAIVSTNIRISKGCKREAAMPGSSGTQAKRPPAIQFFTTCLFGLFSSLFVILKIPSFIVSSLRCSSLHDLPQYEKARRIMSKKSNISLAISPANPGKSNHARARTANSHSRTIGALKAP